MNGRPERAQTNVRLVRRAQPRATGAHALPLTVTIVVVTAFVAALLTRTTGSAAALIGPWDPPVVSTANRSPDAAKFRAGERAPLSQPGFDEVQFRLDEKALR